MILWRSGGKGSLTELMNYEAVSRTAPATPGLLFISNIYYSAAVIVVGRYVTKKSCTRETLNLSAFADSSTDAKRLKLV